MKLVVSAQGDTLDALTSPVFGRCPTYVFVDSDTMVFEAVANSAANQGEGAGIQAAQFVIEKGAQALLTGNLGPNAFAVLQAAGVVGYFVQEGTVRQAVEAFQAGKLQPIGSASSVGYSGVEGIPVPGTGRGQGRRMGQGRGCGRGMRMCRGGTAPSPLIAEPQTAPNKDVEKLRETIESLREQLAAASEQLERLQRKA